MLLITGSISLLVYAGSSWAYTTDDQFPDIEFHGLLDLRYLHADGADTWVHGGLSKFSYGNGQSGQNLINFNQAALVTQSRLDWNWSGLLTAKYSERQDIPVDISEAILLFRPVSTSAWRYSARFGAFFPPISFENSGLAWSNPYTLSNSAINSWVGEELKVFGGEGQLSYAFSNGDKVNVFGAGYANNDTAGVLLAWRGWSLDDYTATINDSFALPQTGLGAFFPLQAATTRPFVEVDGRPGFYLGLSLERPDLGKIRGMYYDNRGNPGVVKNGQYAWHTRFGSLGLKMDLAWETELIAQSMLGRTQMGNFNGNLFAVDTSFWAASAMLSKKMGPHRFSIRYEHFGSSENDYFPQDPNKENGAALTCNYNISLMDHQQINFEMSQIDSDRASRLQLGLTAGQNQTLWQVAYRVFF